MSNEWHAVLLCNNVHSTQATPAKPKAAKKPAAKKVCCLLSRISSVHIPLLCQAAPKKKTPAKKV